MYTHVLAYLLDEAANEHVDYAGMAAHHAQGASGVQYALHKQFQQALHQVGADLKKMNPAEYREAAHWLRSGATPDVRTPPPRLADIFRLAADWLKDQDYGPVRCALGNDMIAAVEYATCITPEQFDALSVIIQAVPAQTVMDWEWNRNPEGKAGALALLRKLAADPPEPGLGMHPDAPDPVRLKIDLTSVEPGGGPLHSEEDRKRLLRGYKEKAANATGSLAAWYQRRADELGRA